MERSIDLIRKSIASRETSMKVAQTRLEERTRRMNVELCHDEAMTGWVCEDVTVRMWLGEYEDVTVRMWLGKYVRMWLGEYVRMWLWGCDWVSMMMWLWGCEDVTGWVCEDVTGWVWGCDWVRLWECDWVRLWECDWVSHQLQLLWLYF